MDDFDETMKDIKDNLIARIQRQEKEIERLYSIIKEVIEYIEHSQNYGKEKIIYINGNDILEILDKVVIKSE